MYYAIFYRRNCNPAIIFEIMEPHFIVGLINAQSAVEASSKEVDSKIKSYLLDRGAAVNLFAVTETFSKPGEKGKQMFRKKCCPPGFDFEHHPRASSSGQKPRGGVALIFKRSSVSAVIETRYSPDHWAFEYLDLDLKVKVKVDEAEVLRELRVIVLYRKPETSIVDFLEDFEYLMKKAARQTPRNLLVLGDFNIHINKPTDPDARKFLKFIEFSRLEQHVPLEPTHELGNTLDLVLSYTNENLVYDLQIVNRDVITFSDHNLVEFKLFPPSNNSNVKAEEIKKDAAAASAKEKNPKTQKFIKFVSEPIDEKSVSALPGIGKAGSNKLREDGIEWVRINII